MASQICIPRHADPVELETLHLKFGCGILQVIARSRVMPVVQEPLDRIDVDADIDRVWLEALGLRRCDQPVALGTTSVAADPCLRACQVARDDNRIPPRNLPEQCSGRDYVTVENSLDERGHLLRPERSH